MAAKSSDCYGYTTFSSAIDLHAQTKGQEIDRLVIVAATGTSTITGKTSASGATARTVGVLAGDVLDVQFRTIDSVSGVTSVRIEWTP
jgi:hypothetical protein